MPSFKYRAKRGPEDVAEGVVEAPTEQQAIDKVSQMGLFPLSVTPQAVAADQPSQRPPVGATGRIPGREITIMSRQLASLIKSGVPILTSINIIAEQSDNGALRSMLRAVHRDVKDGSTFSSSLGRYPRAFSSLYIAMIRAGEDSGNLPEVLLRITDYRAKQEEMIVRFRTAMAYPVLMAFVGVGTVIFMLTYVMPRLMGIFSNLGQRLPLPTRILLAISSLLRQRGALVAIVIAAAILLLRRYFRTKPGRTTWSTLVLHLPIFGKLLIRTELARFARTLELLIKGGIPILRALDIAIPVVSNVIIQQQLKASYRDLEQGGSFGRSLKNSKTFPGFVTNLIIVGEESGKLNDALSEVAAAYERDTDEAIRILASLLEPMMILIMGAIVGFIVIAMLLPIFEINVMAH